MLIVDERRRSEWPIIEDGGNRHPQILKVFQSTIRMGMSVGRPWLRTDIFNMYMSLRWAVLIFSLSHRMLGINRSVRLSYIPSRQKQASQYLHGLMIGEGDLLLV
jgi:hypothetical protein